MFDINTIGTGLAILGTAEVSKDAVQRLLAPTADYIGAGVLQGTKAVVNTLRVFANAANRIGPRIDEPGRVPPRIMREILDQAPFCEDELTAEYLGGILASSFTDISRDDRGVALLGTLKRLSTYAVRTHYLCYREYCKLLVGNLTFKEVFEGSGLPNQQIAEDTRILAAKNSYSTAMSLGDGEDYYQIYTHVSRALEREDLLRFGVMGDGAFLTRSLSGDGASYQIYEDGFVYDSTSAGDELFLWGLGRGHLGESVDFLLAEGGGELDVSVPDVPEIDGFVRLSDQLDSR